MSLLTTLAESGIQSSRQHCPTCDPDREHSRSLKISQNGYKCFRCGIEGGVKQGLALFNISPKVADHTQKDKTREAAWVVYSRNRKQAEEYLINRGYPSAVLDLEFGFAGFNTLKEAGLNFLEVGAIGLLTQSGTELFVNRVVFPIRTASGKITHFQARSVDPESKCKWLATADKSYGSLNSALYGKHFLERWKSNTTVILCEGISDALALHCVGLPALASFGIQNLNLERHSELVDFDIVAMYDNDRFAQGSNKNAGQFKSWLPILPQLAKLQRGLTSGCKVYTLEIPNISGVKDTFDLCQYLDWSKESIVEYGIKKTQPLCKKIIDIYGLENPADAIKLLAGVPLDAHLQSRIEDAVIKNGGWLSVIENAFY